MTNEEITREIRNDYKIITESSTLQRLAFEYYAERKRAKVKKDADYPKFRDFKTRSKNKWMALISKKQLHENYTTPEDFDLTCFVYYYNDIGIRVFNCPPSGVLTVFNGHVFTRYRERMNLSIADTLSVVKWFLINNRNYNYKIMPKQDGEQKIIGIIKEGFTLGEVITDNSCWFINKTFVSKAAANLRISSTSAELINVLKKNLINTDPQKDKEHYEDLTRLYNLLGLMNNNDFEDNIDEIMKGMDKDMLNNDSNATDFFIIK